LWKSVSVIITQSKKNIQAGIIALVEGTNNEVNDQNCEKNIYINAWNFYKEIN
jgi:hypothetical protein